jgi:signal transduction histidine kinase
MTEKINSIKEKIINEIKSGKIKMRPKIYFWVKLVLFIFLVAVLFLVSVFLISFILFVLNISGGWFLTKFGWGGIKSLFFSLPWLLILIALIFVFLVEIIISSFGFTYRRPLVYSLAGLLVFAVICGIIIHKTPFHQNLLLSAEGENLPIFGPFYLNYSRMQFPDTQTGVVSSLSDEIIEIREPNGVLLRISVPGKELLPADKKIEKGDVIMMVNKKIKKVKEDSPCYKYNQRRVK